MIKYKKLKRKSTKRKKIILLFVVISLLFISGGYSVLNSNLGFLGSLFANHYENKAIIQSFVYNDTTKFRQSAYKDKIETITLSDSINPPSSYTESWNLGVNDKSNVKGYIVKRNDSDMYDLYIQGDGSLYANSNSTYLFGGLTGLKTINDLNILNTSNVTNMSNMFCGCSGLTSLNVSNFNTSNVTNISNMFYGCSGLTSLNVSNFNTSNVTNMYGMFYNCKVLTILNLSNFNTSNVTNMSNMFYGCSGLTSLNVSNFDTSNVTNMSYMFYSCSGLASLDVCNFNTSKVNNMLAMFLGCSGLTNLDLSNFNTSEVTSMGNMFHNCSSLTELNLSKFNTGSVKGMNCMFYNCRALTILDLSKFNTSNVISMESMFYGCNNLISLNISNFDTSNVFNFSSMFYGCRSLTNLDVSNFDTRNGTSFDSMFVGCSGLTSLDVSNFNTSKVTSMTSMFRNCTGLTMLDLSSFDTSKVINMSQMFNSCNGLITIYASTNWTVENVTSSSSMFSSCDKLVGQSGVTYNSSKVDATMANYTTGYLTLKISFSLYLENLPASNTVITDDGTSGHNMRYIGSSPNNWVLFNGGLWRVIGVFGVDSHGQSGKLVKIQYSGSLGKMAWDDNNVNDWSEATLKTYLNEGTYYNTTLNSSAKQMIQTVDWKLGAAPWEQATMFADVFYNYERGSVGAKANPTLTEWKGNVALAYPSDYIFSTNGGSTYNRAKCLTTAARNVDETANSLWRTDGANAGECSTGSWMIQQPRNLGVHQWTLMPRIDESIRAFSITSNDPTGPFGGPNAYRTNYDVFPVVYLKSRIICKNCSESTAGTQGNPFIIEYI